MARPRQQPAEEPEENGTGLEAAAAPGGMAPLLVEVLDGVTINDEVGVTREAGEQFPVDGLTAVSLAQGGYVSIVGTYDGDMPSPEEARQQGLQAEKDALQARIDLIDAELA